MSSFVYGQGVSPITTHVLAKAEGSPVFAEPEGHGKQPLWVARLTLTDFRCYRDQRIEIDSRPVVLAGPNGAGKTNVLEALSFLVPGRGLRGATIADVARRRPGGTVDTIASGACASSDGVAWAVAARVITAAGAVEIGTGREARAGAEGRDKRLARIDGQPAKGPAAFAEVLSAVWLTPYMDRLFTEGASHRRRFLDRLVVGFDPAHAGRVGAYERALRERARLLRRAGGARRADSAWLAALEETMSAKGVAVAAARRDVAARLNEACASAGGTFPGASIAARGVVEDWLDAGPALAVEERLRETLAASRETDAETGGAAQGPHRSDLAVRHLGKDLAAGDCSTGEQKALVVAIVLADAELRARERGAPPLLLLDEATAHLDERRRGELFERLVALGAQAWLTGTEAALFAPLGDDAQYFRVEDATVAPMTQ
jgi:DNA replication and repair protein RecF